jgi:hypothetical protein
MTNYELRVQSGEIAEAKVEIFQHSSMKYWLGAFAKVKASFLF